MLRHNIIVTMCLPGLKLRVKFTSNKGRNNVTTNTCLVTNLYSVYILDSLYNLEFVLILL